MKVADLIAELSKLPQDSEVYIWSYDGSPTAEVAVTVDSDNDVFIGDGRGR